MNPIARMLAQLDRLEMRLEWLFQRTNRLMPARVNSVDFQELSAFPELVEIKLSEGVFAKRLPIPFSDGLFFFTRFNEGAILPLHCHDCHEILTVEQGNLLDTVTGRNILEGEEVLFPAETSHALKTLESSVTCYVYFKRKKDAPDPDQYEKISASKLSG